MHEIMRKAHLRVVGVDLQEIAAKIEINIDDHDELVRLNERLIIAQERFRTLLSQKTH